ncbi:MAG TPA: hypothetical protein VN616_18125 [Puia sp.]|nr:hypothetical protein [Puia sp.]
MKYSLTALAAFVIVTVAFESCDSSQAAPGPKMNGTWRLVSGMTITKKDTVRYPSDFSMIKVINDTHFAFLRHDLNPPRDSANHFDGGGGTYTLKGDQYTENLDYYSDPKWEGKPFTFTVTFKNDTLTQTGVEKNEAAGVDHVIVEKYVRVVPGAR